MNRKHTKEEYLKIVKKLISINPEIKLSSDFIVGYPGETKKDFNETLSLINKINFINSFSFIYSPRPGTPAANIEINDKQTQKERLIILQNLLNKIQIIKNKNEIGNLKEVLVENKMKDQKKYFGRTRDLTPVILNHAKDSDIGNLVWVEVEKYNQNSLFGSKKIIKSEVAA